MKKLFGIISALVGLFLLYLIAGFVWGVLHMQSCSYQLETKNPTCEQLAENNARNCSYVILRWKKVDYNQELKECRQFEQKKN